MRVSQLLFLPLLALGFLGCSAVKAPHQAVNRQLDPLIASPETHKLVLENDSVRVLRVEIPPGYREPVHTHKENGVMIIEQRARINYFDENGRLLFSTQPPSEKNTVVQWHEPEGPHSIENTDTVPFKAFLIELKQ